MNSPETGQSDAATAPWIAFEPLYPGVIPPQPSTEEAAGLDAVAHLEGRKVYTYPRGSTTMSQEGPEIMLWAGWRAAIPLGFKARLPRGYEMQVRSRSGLALKKGLIVLNAPGTIDSDYPGEWAVILQNTSDEMVKISHNERIAQLVLAPVVRLRWMEGKVGQVGDRVGGFGSTGV
jgi:dUTP pyrophosphatase